MEKKEKAKTPGRGGARPGAGRKTGVKIGPIKANPRNTMLPFRVSERTAWRIKMLRELTKDDDVQFIDLLERWVEEMAEKYGVIRAQE